MSVICEVSEKNAKYLIISYFLFCDARSHRGKFWEIDWTGPEAALKIWRIRVTTKCCSLCSAIVICGCSEWSSSRRQPVRTPTCRRRGTRCIHRGSGAPGFTWVNARPELKHRLQDYLMPASQQDEQQRKCLPESAKWEGHKLHFDSSEAFMGA